MRTRGKVLAIVCAAVVLALAIFVYFRFCFVFGSGVKAGELNQFMYKGWVWKTYEGRLIQSGFRSGGNSRGSGIQSNEFNFSVVDKQVADSLMRCSGKMVELHYKEYRGTLPWRGMQRHIVDKILSVKDIEAPITTIPITGE